MVKSNSANLDVVFHALSDPTRRSILHGLAHGQKTVGKLAKPYSMSLAAVSKHLNVLQTANLVSREKQGSFQIVRLNAEPLKSVENWLAYYEQFWAGRLDALQHLIEGEEK